jgi:hypothetical protein
LWLTIRVIPYFGGGRRRMTPITDVEYQRRRNLLIPLAEGMANQVAGKYAKGSAQKVKEMWSRKWTKEFMEGMDRLWKECSGNPRFVWR